jgi:hypothetical protein
LAETAPRQFRSHEKSGITLNALMDLILFPPASYVVVYRMLHRKYERLKAAALPEAAS